MGLESEISRLKGQGVLVVGDVGLDEYVMGNVRRISPEAPVPVVEVEGEDLRLGLAANVVQNITSLGGEAYLVSVVGQDERAETLKQMLKAKNVHIEGLVADSSRPTTRKLRVMSGQHHIVRVDFEQKKYLSEQMEAKVVDRVSELMAKVKTVILQDYAKGVLSESCIQKIVGLAKSKGKTILVDPNRTTPLSYYRGADLMTPNADEAIQLSGRSGDDIRGVSESMSEVGADLMKAIGSKRMIITRSKDGVSLYEDGRTQLIPTYARQVFDVTGAGDTFIAAIGLSMSAGMSLELSCQIANHAAGVVVGKVGAATCTFEELQTSIRSRNS